MGRASPTAWRQQETTRINALGLPEQERLAALAVVLNNETRMLQTIDRLKIAAARENREARIRRTLERMSAPKAWPAGSAASNPKERTLTVRGQRAGGLIHHGESADGV